MTAQAPLDVSDDVPWADDIHSAMDVTDGLNPADNVDMPDDAATLVLSDEKY